MLDVTPVEATVAHTLLSVLAIQLGRCPRYNHRVMSPRFILALVPPFLRVDIVPKLMYGADEQDTCRADYADELNNPGKRRCRFIAHIADLSA
jgi:hypothetical protein